MDLLTYWRVLKRQRRVVLVGLGLTVLLSGLMFYRTHSRGPLWAGKSTLFVTQTGFPWGSSSSTADPARMEYLASLYSQLAETDEVRSIVTHGTLRLPTGDWYFANQGLAPDGSGLPLIEIDGISPSGERSVALGNRVAAALQAYIGASQRANGIPPRRRIVLQVVKRAEHPQVYAAVKLTTPIMLMLLGVVATLFAAFTLDNVRRQRWLAEAGLASEGASTQPVTEPVIEPVADPVEVTDAESEPEPAAEPRLESVPGRRVHQLGTAAEPEVESAAAASKPRRWA